MKILYLDQTAQLGGGELSLLVEVTRLPHQATVLLFEDGILRERFRQSGIAVEIAGGAFDVRKQGGLRGLLRAVPAVIGLAWTIAARARRHDLIYANSQKAFVIGALASALSGRPLVWRLRDILSAAHFSAPLRRVVIGFANWRATRVIANSAATAQAFADAGGDRRRVSVAYPPVDPTPFMVGTNAGAAIRLELGAGDRPVIAVFGRLAEWKGQHVFIDAIAKTPDVIGVVIGAALFGEQPYADALRVRAAACGVTARLRFLGFREDVPALMAAADIIVHSSVAPEPFGRVVVEAMLANRPVVAAAAGGVTEIITHGVTGLLYEPGNAQALAACLETLLADRDKAAVIAARGRAHALAQFSADATIAAIEKVIGSLGRD